MIKSVNNPISKTSYSVIVEKRRNVVSTQKGKHMIDTDYNCGNMIFQAVVMQ